MSPIHVVAGVLRDPAGRVLVAQRARGKHLAGLWEFPGGKVESGESAAAALRRELREELGVAVRVVEPLIAVPWRYQDKTILLDAYSVSDYAGAPRSRENQAIAWHRVDEIPALEMPPADRPIVNALRLPDHYAITPEPDADDVAFLGNIECALINGVQLLQLRAKTVGAARLRKLALASCELARAHGARILINGDVALARDCDADGVHLNSVELMRAKQRPLPSDKWLGASCHNAAEICKANALGVDFGVLGPVAATASHDGALPTGWAFFIELCSLAAFPVFGLGGLHLGDLKLARASGAQGVAGISAFFSHSR